MTEIIAFMPSGLFYLNPLNRSICIWRDVWFVFIITMFYGDPCIKSPVWSVFAVRMKKVWVLSYQFERIVKTDQTGWMPRLILCLCLFYSCTADSSSGREQWPFDSAKILSDLVGLHHVSVLGCSLIIINSQDWWKITTNLSFTYTEAHLSPRNAQQSLYSPKAFSMIPHRYFTVFQLSLF